VSETADAVGGRRRPRRDRQQRAVGDRARGALSAAFILIGGKVGDLIGRRRAYVLEGVARG